MHIPEIKSFFWETEKDEKLKNLHTEESLSTIEEQLLDMENNHYKRKLTQKILVRRVQYPDLINNNNCFILHTRNYPQKL